MSEVDKTTEKVKEIKYSVVIPIYNKEEYLNDCIQSVIEQRAFDLNQLEIILINDGSKDKSLEICKETKEC